MSQRILMARQMTPRADGDGERGAQPWDALPRATLGEWPTPLQYLERFSAQVGQSIYAKRDDWGSMALAGNKLRKLEFLVGQARRDGRDVLITVGAAQSNHARTTAAVAAACGLECHLVLGDHDASTSTGGNRLLDSVLGAVLHVVPTAAWDELEAAAVRLAADLEARGRRPMVIPMGGSVPVGSVGYVAAYVEMLDQTDALKISPRAVYLATSTGGTQAGLEVGRHFAGRGPGIIGVGVTANGGALKSQVASLANGTSRLLGRSDSWDSADVAIEMGFLGSGYAAVTPGAIDAIQLLARTEGILCDPVYSGKALAAVVAGARAGIEGPVVFWHTGGAPALFSRKYAKAVTRGGR